MSPGDKPHVSASEVIYSFKHHNPALEAQPSYPCSTLEKFHSVSSGPHEEALFLHFLNCCSVAKLCLTLCDLVDCSTPGFCPSLFPEVCSNSGPLSQWCHPTISSSALLKYWLLIRIHLPSRRRGYHPWVRKIPGEGTDNPLQYSCLWNHMDRGVWWATVRGVAKNWMQLSN